MSATADEPAAATHTADLPAPQSSTSTSTSTPTDTNIVRDVYLWRRWQLSAAVLVVTTAIWVVMEVYKFNFVTAVSWLAIFLVSSLFTWGNIHRLFRKEEPDMSRLGISEQTAVEVANSVRELGEEGARWLFRIGAEKEWFVFAGTVAGLWLLSVIGSCSDLLTLLYVGNLAAMIVPPVYVRYDYKIKEYTERLKMQGRRFYSMFDERVIQKLKNRAAGAKKEKKVESLLCYFP